MINLRPHSSAEPLEIPQEEYDRLVTKKEGGWSGCADEKEWLAKLHYLRSGLDQGKLESAQFEERELRLVTNWLKRMTG